jgi:parallel beta-helix repeat protein
MAPGPGAFLASLSCCACSTVQEATETVTIERDDTRIERSCRLELPPSPAADAAGDGVIQIVGDGITVELSGELLGAGPELAPDAYTGVGIRITGKDVTLRGARVSGFRVGIHAEGADGLVLQDCDVSGNFRQHLASTKEKEAEEDWLDPHHNDQREWFTRYGAGIYVERSKGVTVRRCRARRGQNGLVLDRCEEAQVYDNDFSFLSGWGIALWRSSWNMIARNACDFCIRGYSHGVYNRGQDSAGILLFEQCSHNVIAENSATHCGDGFFGFAGQEALGGVAPRTSSFDYTMKGCNINGISGNDLSYAAAHGLEMTFSFANDISRNRMVGNSICGVWAGYSRDTTIQENHFEENGAAGYGLERGGVNIEHGERNIIVRNSFKRNACGVHLWWDADEHLVNLPWARANGHRSAENVIAANTFDGDTLAIQLRDCEGTMVRNNTMKDVGQELEVTGPPPLADGSVFVATGQDRASLPGDTRPVGARPHLAGRDKIVIDEWGPVEPAPR